MTSYIPLMQSSGAGTSNEIPLQESGLLLPAVLITLPIFIDWNQLLRSDKLFFKILQLLRWHSIYHSTRLTLMFFMWSNRQMTKAYPDPIRRFSLTPQRYQVIIPETWSLFHPLHHRLNAPQILTIDDNSNEPTMPYGFGRQLLIIPPILNDFNLPPNPFNVLATMAIANNTEDAKDNNYSPESPESSELSPISTPPRNVSAFNSWETSYTTTNDDIFYSSDEPKRIYSLPPTPSPPMSPPRKMKRTLSLEMSFPKNGGVSQHVCEACGQTIPTVKDIPGPSSRK